MPTLWKYDLEYTIVLHRCETYILRAHSNIFTVLGTIVLKKFGQQDISRNVIQNRDQNPQIFKKFLLEVTLQTVDKKFKLLKN